MSQIVLRGITIDFTIEVNPPRTLKSVAAHFFRPRRLPPRRIRALDISELSVRAGERVGLIGRNGAGKSTLLKVMAQIYPPHQGKAYVEGHICPLFEFATGFEMEASGWDNIRTRALLLGMPPREIEAKLDDIGAFTELDDFLDLPVRCYSAGMLLRLAFATSTAVDPEILLLDEVMAAGDASFIERARTRMEALMGRANIVVFASHSLEILPKFCDRTIWLDHGKIMRDGPTTDVIRAYQQYVHAGQLNNLSLGPPKVPVTEHLHENSS